MITHIIYDNNIFPNVVEILHLHNPTYLIALISLQQGNLRLFVDIKVSSKQMIIGCML